MTKIFVFDANILISANLLPKSVSRKAYDKAIELGIPVYSDTTLAEFSETLVRPKFDKYTTFHERVAAISNFEKVGQHIRVFKRIDICRDPKDNKYLELAAEVNATCIITGDNDLLTLHPFNGIPILTPAAFLNEF